MVYSGHNIQIQQPTGGNMSKDIFEPLGNIDMDAALKEFEESECEMEQHRKEINAWLCKAGFAGCKIILYGGLIFIFNNDKTKKKQLRWLNKYSEVLRKYDIEATVYDDQHNPYICF
jgi:hypothetical protein